MTLYFPNTFYFLHSHNKRIIIYYNYLLFNNFVYSLIHWIMYISSDFSNLNVVWLNDTDQVKTGQRHFDRSLTPYVQSNDWNATSIIRLILCHHPSFSLSYPFVLLILSYSYIIRPTFILFSFLFWFYSNTFFILYFFSSFNKKKCYHFAWISNVILWLVLNLFFRLGMYIYIWSCIIKL